MSTARRVQSTETRFLDLGTVNYDAALKIQKALLGKRINGHISDTVLILEHEPVVTIGRGGGIKSIKDMKRLAERNIKVLFADRGGDATFHCPGQLVMYPIINLGKLRKDVHLYIRFLESVAMNFLKSYGVVSRRQARKTGVWVGLEKIASIGIGVKKWVTFHGVSVNIKAETGPFAFIKACGETKAGITSLSRILNEDINTEDAKERLRHEFSDTFGEFYGMPGKEAFCKEIFA